MNTTNIFTTTNTITNLITDTIINTNFITNELTQVNVVKIPTDWWTALGSFATLTSAWFMWRSVQISIVKHMESYQDLYYIFNDFDNNKSKKQILLELEDAVKLLKRSEKGLREETINYKNNNKEAENAT